MKWLIILLFILPLDAYSQRYEVKKRCTGNSNSAIVIEYQNQYHVVVTPQYFQHNWVVTSLDGIGMGGTRTMYYSEGGTNRNMNVRVLGRFRWKYSGLPGATGVCRKVVNENLF